MDGGGGGGGEVTKIASDGTILLGKLAEERERMNEQLFIYLFFKARSFFVCIHFGSDSDFLNMNTVQV